MLRGRKLRAHLKACDGCRGFKQMIDVRQRDLAAITPALPAFAAATLLQGLIGGSHGSGGILAGLAGGAAGKVAATSTVAKGVATIAVVATVGAGTAGVTGNLPAPLDRKAPAGQARDAGAAVSSPGPPGALGRDTSRTRPTSNKRRSPAARAQNANGRRRALLPDGVRRSRPAVPNPRRSRPAGSHKPTRATPLGRRPPAVNRGAKARPSTPATKLPRAPGKAPALPIKPPNAGGQPAVP